MNPLLEQFLSESRDFLQSIGEKLMQLEKNPDDAVLINELFRFVHTLKGNSGLFEFPDMTRLLHAGEDLMDAVRNGLVGYSQVLADRLLDVMDFIGLLCDEIESTGRINASRAVDANHLAEGLRSLITKAPTAQSSCPLADSPPVGGKATSSTRETPEHTPPPLADIPESHRMEAYRRSQDGYFLHWVTYTPEEECFFQGDDPLFTVRQTPDLLWGRIVPREPWPPLAELNAYRCMLDFHLLTAAPNEELAEHYRYVPDQVRILAIDPLSLILPHGDRKSGPVSEDFVVDALQYLEAGNSIALRQATQALLERSNPELWLSSVLRWLLVLLDSVPDNHVALRTLIESLRLVTPPDWAAASASPGEAALAANASHASGCLQTKLPLEPRLGVSEEDASVLEALLVAQRQILTLSDHPTWRAGRFKSVADVLINCSKAIGDSAARAEIESALEQSLAAGDGAPLLACLDVLCGRLRINTRKHQTDVEAEQVETGAFASGPLQPVKSSSPLFPNDSRTVGDAPRFGRRAEDSFAGPIKVDQAKIDRLMSLIGEMVVSKNALPYLAQRAENQYKVRELSREIKAQYLVINRIAEEMQDAIMQVRMRPMSFVFERFPRLVRDISRKLGKEVHLELEGEETEADKNIIESLADPLIHIVRNSLDHGLETPQERRASGKSPTGRLTIRATQEADRVLLDIIDDGKGIDPTVIKRKAYEKGVIDEATLERITDQDAINLVFVAGFSTAEAVSDLSGRGVGMDVVRTAVDKVNGSIQLESEVGKGSHIRISLPLSMAVTKVMLVESDRQFFGVPMDYVVETVRVPRSAIRTIKHSLATVLRGRVVPLKALNALLALPAEPKANADDELAVLVARVGGDVVGLMVDDFRETVDIIQKPLVGVLSGLTAYSGSALMGDGSVLMVLDVKEIL